MKMPQASKRWLRWLAIVAVAGLVAGGFFALWVGQQLAAPVPRTIGPPPATLGGETVKFPSASGSTIVGWLTEHPAATGAILLLHGVRADRRSMTDRARFLGQAGYHTLCIDFQAHGESPGQHITMGHLEALDAAAGVAFLRQRFPRLPVAVVGTSLGGASALLADYERPPEAFVVEAAFADLTTAVDNRMETRFGAGGRLLAPLLTWQFRYIVGIDASEISPVRAIATIKQPVLILHGSADRHARPAEAKALFAAAQGPKEIWEVPGAAHVDLHRFAKPEYERRVGAFLAKYLQLQ